MAGDNLLLSTAYMAPIGYFATMARYPAATIEKHETYIRQSFRNRCTIAAANGLLTLTVPVKRGSFHNVPIKDIEIDYSRRWIAVHIRSIVSAYRNSPYFDYFADEILRIIGMMTPKLLDLNMMLTEHISGILDISTRLSFSETFAQPEGLADDLRYTVSPKVIDRYHNSLEFPPYLQSFSDRYPFQSDLSIIDLIFNLGPASGEYLSQTFIR
jgi:hypothetical protein